MRAQGFQIITRSRGKVNWYCSLLLRSATCCITIPVFSNAIRMVFEQR